MLRKVILIAILLLWCCDSFAATYWIAPDGRVSAKGTEYDPFPCIEDALAQVGGGNTFIFKPGVYVGAQITIYAEHSGTSQNPTVLKSQNKYEAVLHGSPFHNIYVKEGCKWVIIDGFESSGARYTGIKSNADYTVIRNCRIHNNALQGIEAHGVYGTVIENNIVEYNGEHLQYDHGMYVDGENLTIRNNIVRFNSGWGIHMYPEITDSRIENNLVYGNDRWGICLYSKPGIGSNEIVNNTIVFNGGGIAVKNGLDEVIVNNIIVNNTMWMFEKSEPIRNLSDGDLSDSNVIIDYNLCFPRYSGAGPHGISGDPKFLDASKGTFYLTSGSPAIGKGSQEYAPERDFFNRSMQKNKAPDLGCFPYDYSLLSTKARQDWYYKWPFLYKGKGTTMPDLWKLPESDGSDTGYKYK